MICIAFLALISISFWVITPWGTDIEFHILRIVELGKELSRKSSIPVYMYSDVYNHYGYPLPIFYCPLFLLPGSLLAMAGLDPVSAYKVMVVITLWGAFASAYICIKQISGYIEDLEERQVLLGAFVYSIQPFFLIELFVRASLGSSMVFIFIPWVLLGYYRIVNGIDPSKGVICLACGISGIVLSHVTSTVIVVLALLVLFLVQIRHFANVGKTIAKVAVSAAMSLLLCAWYVFPMMEQLAFATYNSQNVDTLWIPKENLFAMFMPMHLSIALSALLHKEVPYSMIGGSIIPVIVLVIFYVRHKLWKELGKTEHALVWIYFSICCVLLIRWSIIERYIAFIQFAWRIFLIASIIGTVLFILLIRRGKEGQNNTFVLITIIICAVYVLMFFFGYHGLRTLAPSIAGRIAGHDFTEYQYESETPDDLYIPVYVDREAVLTSDRTVYAQGADYSYKTDEDRGCIYIDVNETDHETLFECPFIMYPGYSARGEDGTEYTVMTSENGYVSVLIPEDMKGRVCVSYTGTKVQRITFFISVIALVVCVIVSFLNCMCEGKRITQSPKGV